MIKETEQRNNNLYKYMKGDSKTKEIEVSDGIKDSTMKLFGRTISVTHNNDVSTINDSSSESEIVLPLPDHEDFSDHSSHSSLSSPLEVNSPTEHEAKRYKESSSKELTSQQTTSSGLTENPKTPSSETETSRPNSNSTVNGEQTDMSQQDTSPMKPDKIAPCPRCKSMDTKFCYYNNYNVKQPRHFCKNCQRYWTAGGIIRNMLVGAGRRKTKISSLPSVVSQSPVLTFGSDSSIMSSNSIDKEVNVGSHEETFDKSHQSFPPQFPFQGASTFSTPWPYPWNPAMSYPVTFYPNMAYYGGCFPPPWSVQPISNQSLGKHSRDGNIVSHSNSEKEKLCSESNNNSVLIPKTLRIDDPNDVAKSSIWSTLGIKNGGGLFKAFESKGADKNHVVEVSSSVLQANPAASSRSLLFHEMV